MTNPAHYTDPAWAAREARRQALEEAAALVAKKTRKPTGSYDDWARGYNDAIDDAEYAIRALAAREP